MLVNRESPHFNVILKLQEARNMFKYSEYIEDELRARHGPFPLVNLRYSHKRRYVCMARKLVEKKELSKMQKLIHEKYRKEFLVNKNAMMGVIPTEIDVEEEISKFKGKRGLKVCDVYEPKGSCDLDDLGYEVYSKPRKEDFSLEEI